MAGKSSKISMQHIAEHLGISKNAVSLALNDKPGVSPELRERVLDAAQRFQYRLKPGFKGQSRSSNILVLIPEYIRNDKIFYYDVFWAIEQRAKTNGMNSILFTVTKDMELQCRIPKLLEEMSFIGILMIGVFETRYVQLIIDLKLPTVTVDHYYDDIRMSAVITANSDESRRLMKVLIDLGHRDIGFIGAIHMTNSFMERWLGFQQAMTEAGLPVNLRHCITDSSPLEVLMANSYELEVLLNELEDMPTAWFCANDKIAIELIKLLSSQGIKVPDDISVAGFDDIEAARLVSPSITTIGVPREQMGKEAVDLLVRMNQNHDSNLVKLSLYGDLIMRDSVAAPSKII
jgi:DNA-binding LacI/PurR family transcriptional regulator